MYLHTQQLINEIAPGEPDPAAANALQEGLGGQFGEMRTMMQYLFQSMNVRGDPTSKPYKDLIQGVGTEEISHVELIGTTIARSAAKGAKSARQTLLSYVQVPSAYKTAYSLQMPCSYRRYAVCPPALQPNQRPCDFPSASHSANHVYPSVYVATPTQAEPPARRWPPLRSRWVAWTVLTALATA